MVGVAAKDPRGLIPGWAFDLLTEDFRKKHHTSHAYTDTDPPPASDGRGLRGLAFSGQGHEIRNCQAAMAAFSCSA
ncbi:hypothetical protein FHX41_5025 [Actinomadura hallensis]|uniref:Uncharacterized protein n=1 Tax=Actinomadura hallensis TaxID=337895 RepID=A0A543IKZ5_9ACTN|nr:hypothetical protein FHX41_5025 [Actinomadura hallensis]